MKISLEALVQRLIAKGAAEARTTPPASGGVSSPTSLRLKPTTRHFLECEAAALNTSLQALIGMILDGVAEASIDVTSGTLRTIRERFFLLFSAHGLDLPSTISILKDQGFTLSALDDPARLMDLFNQNTINYLAKTFTVRPEWISAASDSVTERGVDVRWYKNVYAMGQKLLEYAQQGLHPHVLFIRRTNANFEKAKMDNDEGRWPEEPIGVVVRLHRSTDDGVSFRTFEVWEFERWNYARCREQLKLLILFCDQAHHIISCSGIELPEDKVRSLQSGQALPVSLVGGIQMVAWHPDDYACLRSDVTQERDEWPNIKRAYEDGKYDDLIKEMAPRPFRD